VESSCERGNETSSCIKILKIYRVAAQLGGLSSGTQFHRVS
jgi:hypothetical protein